MSENHQIKLPVSEHRDLRFRSKVGRENIAHFVEWLLQEREEYIGALSSPQTGEAALRLNGAIIHINRSIRNLEAVCKLP